ncbi:hypothetical protein [Bradyrhizobium sp. 23]|uniref:hypothetical protein n=1 Tax=Bradyrhizobium sp. 23 TaxID=2782667 RepID=UPI001FFBADD6|nr:hypothetical protein [Bradyrhizobium sp. 23]MCK1315408.1 hypothetical protein [Bradyrhizobium sp. 23]
MTPEMERLRERLQTGWQPKPDEIDMRIRQRRIRDWQFAPSFSPPEAAIIGRPESREGVIRTDVILWIDAGLRWALCEDGMWWWLSE